MSSATRPPRPGRPPCPSRWRTNDGAGGGCQHTGPVRAGIIPRDERREYLPGRLRRDSRGLNVAHRIRISSNNHRSCYSSAHESWGRPTWHWSHPRAGSAFRSDRRDLRLRDRSGPLARDDQRHLRRDRLLRRPDRRHRPRPTADAADEKLELRFRLAGADSRVRRRDRQGGMGQGSRSQLAPARRAGIAAPRIAARPLREHALGARDARTRSASSIRSISS